MSECVLPVHPITGLTALGIGARGPIWPILGAADDEPDDDEDPDDDDGSLIDDEATNGDDAKGKPKKKSIEDLLADQTKLINAEIDRRVNGVTAKLRKELGGDSKTKDDPKEPAATGPDKNDRREARSEFRDGLDGFKYVDDVEREAVQTMGSALIERALSTGADPEIAGQEAARTVRDQMTKLRAAYERATVASLKRKGLLIEADKQNTRIGAPGGRVAGGTLNPVAGYQAGQNKAAELLPGRVRTATK